MRTDPSALAWLVGNELRQVRERFGETQASAAKVIGCSTSRMNYLETGRTVQQPDDVRALMRFYEAPKADGERLASLVELPGRRTWWTPWEPVIPEHLKLFAGLEGFAAGEFVYLASVIPGLLQTADYSAALVDLAHAPPMVRDRVVEFRQARQQRLLADQNPLRLTVVIEEDALDRLVGGAEAMRAQLDHLLAMAERDNVTVRVMPRSVAVHDGLAGAFTLLDFAATQSIGYIEYPDGSVYIAEYHQVAGFLYLRDRLRAQASDAAQSLETIAARRAALE
ncbi:MAG: helix-turn-helix domain-containing protein [Actinomycetota bacterium]|nr:helix-turn-helix domain-containing protein [Actinomycetota bacterium]